MKNGKLTVAIVGMGFGSCFLPIYLKHPDVEHVIMVDTNPDQLKALAEERWPKNKAKINGTHRRSGL